MCSVRLSAELWLSCGSALCEPIMLNLTEQGQAAAALLGLGPVLQAYRAVRGDDESQSTKTATAVQVQAMLKVCEVVSELLPELVVHLPPESTPRERQPPPRPDRVDGLHTLRGC